MRMRVFAMLLDTQNIVGHVAVEAVVDKQLDLVLAGQLGVALANQK